jgi:ATP/maltotriose-dependent transcriptional regulator MalT
LRIAERRQLIRPAPEGAISFTHDMIRETLYAQMNAVRRRRLHLAIGEAIEARADVSDARRLADLAFHFAEAGERVRGAAYAQAAGEQALGASAPAEAVNQFENALSLLGSAGDADQRAAALSGLGRAATLCGDYERAAGAYREVRDVWLRGGDTRAAARAWHELGRIRWRQEATTEARDAFRRALDLFGPADSEDAAETLLQLADLSATSLGRNSEGLAYAEQARTMVERLGDRRLEAAAYCVAGNVKARSDDLEGGRTLLERALTLAQDLDDPALAAEASAYLANVHAWRGDTQRSIEVSIVRAGLAERSQDPHHLRHVYSWIGLQEVCRGRFAAAEQWLLRQQHIVEGLRGPEPRASLQLCRGVSCYYRGRFAKAEEHLRDASEHLRPTASATLIWHLGWLGLALIELDRRDEALSALDELEALGSTLDERARARGAVFAKLAAGYARLGERERAAACYPRLLPFEGQFTPLMVDRGLGIAALAGGDPARAVRHLLSAEAATRDAGLLPELALTLLQRGLVEGDREQKGPLAEGWRLCEELGMSELARRLTVSDAPARTRHDAHPAGLSDRELEVLRLVAQGRTNREIADALFLSDKTVARHLTHIYTKIGVENRTGAAAFALRHDLA